MTEGERSPAWGSSLSWQSLNVLLQVMLQLAYMSLLARWIGVEDFGVMAIALVVVGIAGAGDPVTLQAQQGSIHRTLCKRPGCQRSPHLAVGRGNYGRLALEHRGSYRKETVVDAAHLASNLQGVEDD